MKTTFALAAMFATTLAAAIAGESAGKKSIIEAARTEVPLTITSFRSSYTFESDFKRGDDASGDAWFNGAYVAHRFPLSWSWPNQNDAGWFFRLGAEYGRFDFDNAGSLPLPDTLQNANAVVAFEYLVAGEVALLLETLPGFYYESDPNSDSFDIPTKLAAAFPLTPRLFLVAGATYRGQFEKFPILPVLGVVWRVNDEWTLRLLAPSPRIIYRATDNLRLWVGGELSGGAYRVDDDKDRPAKLRGGVVSYSEYKVGAGFTFGNPDRLAVDVGAGYAFQRKFDYHRAEEGYETDEGAPYVRVSLSAGF